MKEEPKFYAIDEAIEVAENPKYGEVVPTRVEAFKEIKRGGETKVPFNKIVKSSVYTRWNNVETSEAAKAEGRLKTIETLKNSMVIILVSKVLSAHNLSNHI